MSRFKATSAFVLAAGLLLLMGCGNSAESSKGGKPSAARYAASPSQDGDWVSAAHSSGVELPLALHFELPDRPAVGQAFPVQLKLEASEAIEDLALHLVLPDGLQAAGPPFAVNKSRLPAGGLVEHRLSLKPVREGMFEVRLQVTLAGSPGKERSEVFSIPVIVSKP